MRKIFTLLFFTGISFIATAQWSLVHYNTSATFYDASFPTDNSGFVAMSDSAGAAILHTSNGGVSWNKTYIPGWTYINKISMTDSLRGYIIKGGSPVEILKTTDAFATFTTHTLDSSFIVMDLEIRTDSTGYYLNNAGRLRRFSDDGGAFEHVMDTGGVCLQFINSNIAYMDGGTTLLKTVDGGITWATINSNFGFWPITFHFTNALTGYFSDGTYIYKTTDGGLTFTPVQTFANHYSLIATPTACMVANDNGDVTYTIDNGATWQNEITGINYIVNEPYKLFITPGGYIYMFSEFGQEIRKRTGAFNGVEETQSSTKILLYPNPATDKLQIETDSKIINVEIHSTTGEKILESAGKIMDVSSLANGMYIATISLEKNRKTTVKFIKE